MPSETVLGRDNELDSPEVSEDEGYGGISDRASPLRGTSV